MSLFGIGATSTPREQLIHVMRFLEALLPPANIYQEITTLLRQIKDQLEAETEVKTLQSPKISNSKKGNKVGSENVAKSPKNTKVGKNNSIANHTNQKNSKNAKHAKKAGNAVPQSTSYASKMFTRRPREESAKSAKPRTTRQLLKGAADLITTKRQATCEYYQVIKDVNTRNFDAYEGKMSTDLVHRNLADATETTIVLMTSPNLKDGLGCQSIAKIYGPPSKTNDAKKLEVGEIHEQLSGNKRIWRVVNKEKHNHVPTLGTYLMNQEKAFFALRKMIIDKKITSVALIRPGVHDKITWNYTLTKMSQIFFDVDVKFVFYGLPHKNKENATSTPQASTSGVGSQNAGKNKENTVPTPQASTSSAGTQKPESSTMESTTTPTKSASKKRPAPLPPTSPTVNKSDTFESASSTPMTTVDGFQSQELPQLGFGQFGKNHSIGFVTTPISKPEEPDSSFSPLVGSPPPMGNSPLSTTLLSSQFKPSPTIFDPKNLFSSNIPTAPSLEEIEFEEEENLDEKEEIEIGPVTRSKKASQGKNSQIAKNHPLK